MDESQKAGSSDTVNNGGRFMESVTFFKLINQS